MICVLKDLGIIPYGTQGKRYKMAEIQCQCGKIYKTMWTNVKFHRQKACSGCKKISVLKRIEEQQRIPAANKFITQAAEVHGNWYTYERVVYTTARKHVYVTCPRHGDWPTTPDNHLRGTGCPKCGAQHLAGAQIHGQQTLYYVYFPNLRLWKIGITSKTVKERFRTEKEQVEILQYKHFADGYTAHMIEQYILNTYYTSAYKGEKVLCSGNTELYAQDILDKIHMFFTHQTSDEINTLIKTLRSTND